MEQIKSWLELNERIQKDPVLLIYLSSRDCSVCMADAASAEKLSSHMNFPAVHFDVNDVPEVAGQLNVFSLPAVLLYYQGKEYHRQARIIDFHELEKRMNELLESGI